MDRDPSPPQMTLEEAAQAGHTLSVDMLSLSDGNLPSLSMEAAGDFLTESFRCESGFQLLLEHISDPNDQPGGVGPSATAHLGGASAGDAQRSEGPRHGTTPPNQPPLQLPAVTAPSPAFLRMMAAAQAQRAQQLQAPTVSEPLAAQIPRAGAGPMLNWPPTTTRVLSDPTEAPRELANAVLAWPPASTRVLSDPSQAAGQVTGTPAAAAAPSHRRAGSGGAAVTRHGGDHISKPNRSQSHARSPAAAAQLIAAAQDARSRESSAPRQQPQWPWQSATQPPTRCFGHQAGTQPGLAGYRPAGVLPAPSAGTADAYREPGPGEGGASQPRQTSQPTLIELAGTGSYLLGQLGSEQAGFRPMTGTLPADEILRTAAGLSPRGFGAATVPVSSPFLISRSIDAAALQRNLPFELPAEQSVRSSSDLARAAELDGLEQRHPKLRSISGPGGGGTMVRPPYAGVRSSSPDEPLPASTSTRARSLGTDARPVVSPFLSEVASPHLLAGWPEQLEQPQTRRWQQQQEVRQVQRLPDPSTGGLSAPAQAGAWQAEPASPAAGQGGKPKRKYRSRLNIPQRPFLAAASAARMEAARMVQQADESSEAGIHSAPSSSTTSPILATSPILGVTATTSTSLVTAGGPIALSSNVLSSGSPDLRLGGTRSAPANAQGSPATGSAAGEVGPDGDAAWQFPATQLDSPSLRDPPPAGTPQLRTTGTQSLTGACVQHRCG